MERTKRSRLSISTLFYESKCLQLWQEEVMPFIKKSFGSDLSTIDRYVQAQRWGSLRTLMEQRSIRHIDPYIALFNAYKAFNNHLRQFSPERYFKKAFSEYKDIPLNERDCLHESYS